MGSNQRSPRYSSSINSLTDAEVDRDNDAKSLTTAQDDQEYDDDGDLDDTIGSPGPQVLPLSPSTHRASSATQPSSPQQQQRPLPVSPDHTTPHEQQQQYQLPPVQLSPTVSMRTIAAVPAPIPDVSPDVTVAKAATRAAARAAGSDSSSTLQAPGASLSASQVQEQAAPPSTPLAEPFSAHAPAAAASHGISVHELSVVVQQSIEFGKAADRIADLQRQNEGLAMQLANAAAARDCAEAALVGLAAQHAQAEHRIRESYEVRLAEKQKELVGARLRLATLEAQGPKSRLLGATADSVEMVKLTGPELAALRRDVSEQETLIRGYQQENEQAMRTIKELEDRLQQVEAAAAEETARMERQLLSAHDDSHSRNAETAAKLRRVLELEKQLDGQKEAAVVREAELRAQIEKLRAEKKELEARKGGVDLKQMQDGDVLVRQVRTEMESLKAAHNAMVAELQAKLRWYAENQELLNRNDDLVRGQQEALLQLQERLAQYEGPAGQARPTLKRVRELEGQVAALQAAARARAPANSIAALVAAARPSPNKDMTEEQQALAGQVAALRAQLARRDEEHEAQVRSHQQQLERLRAQYTERAMAAEMGGGTRRGRAKELERQIDELRALYSKKIRELEQKLRDTSAVAAKAGHAAAAPGATAASCTVVMAPSPSPTKPAGIPGARRGEALPVVAQLKLREADVRRLQGELDRKTRQVAELHVRLAEAEATILRLGDDLQRSSESGAGSRTQGDASGAHGLLRSPMPSASPAQLPYSNPMSLRMEQQAARPPPSQQQRLHTVTQYSALPSQQQQQQPSDGTAMAGEGAGEGPQTHRAQHLQLQNATLMQEVVSLREEVVSLRGKLQESERQRQQLMDQSLAGHAASGGGGAPGEVESLRRRLEASEIALATVQRAHTESVERCAQQAAEHQRVLSRLHDDVAHREAARWQDRLSQMEQSLRSAQARCEALAAELSAARSRQAWSPEAHAFEALERKLDDMQRDQEAREARWRGVLDDTYAMFGVQAEVTRRKWEMALEAKSAEVERFRAELEALLSSARRLRASQQA